MTPKLIQWLGGGLILAILVVVNVAAIKEIASGEGDVRNEWFLVIASAVIVVLTFVLKLVTSRSGARHKRKRR